MALPVSPKAVNRALLVAKGLANRISPGAGDVSMPYAGKPVPLQRVVKAGGGELSAPPVNMASMFGGQPQPQPTAAPSNPDVGKFPEFKGQMSKGVLQDAFKRAIDFHRSLSPEDQIANRKAAEAALIPYIGEGKKGRVRPLITSNGKMMKSEAGYRGQEPLKIADGRGVSTAGLALYPAFTHDKLNLCPNSKSCKDICLGKSSGNYFKVGGGSDFSAVKGPRLNSLNKTKAMLAHPEAFATVLHDEIGAHKQDAARDGNLLGVRLNVLSDLNPAIHKPLMEAHPDVAFYDYTKNNSDPVAPNHHYTYSSTGVSQPDQGVVNPHQNWKQMRARLDQGHNVAMAFSDKEHLPEEVHDEETGNKYRVVNGDMHDFRPADMVGPGQAGVITGLKNKAITSGSKTAAKTSGGFFVHYDPQPEKNANGTIRRGPSYGLNPDTGNPYRGVSYPTNKVVKIATQQHDKLSKLNVTRSGQ